MILFHFHKACVKYFFALNPFSFRKILYLCGVNNLFTIVNQNNYNMELAEKASSYADKNTLNILKEAFARVYSDGYHDGFKDGKEEKNIDVRDNKTEYVDLGLPSGTMWASNFEKAGGENIYISYNEVIKYNIPTNDQCLELYNNCCFTVNNGIIYCIGPNGKSITFSTTGYKEIGNEVLLPSNIGYFWILSEDEQAHNAAAIGKNKGIWHDTRKMFTGYKLPIRLVRIK